MRPEDYSRFVEQRDLARNRLARRMAAASPAKFWRYSLLWPGTRLAVIRANQNFGHEFGRLLALYRADQDECGAEEIRDLLNGSVPSTHVAERLAEVFNEDCGYSHELWRCGDCGEWFLDYEDSVDVEGNRICQSCIDGDRYVYSGCMGEYLDRDHAYPVFDNCRSARDDEADDYCTRSWGRANLYEIAHDEHSYAYMSDCDEACEWNDEGGDEEDCDGRSSDSPRYLPDYHSAPQRRQNYYAEVNSTPSVPALGLEVEVYAPDRGDALEFLRDHSNTLISDMIYERDGSLHEDKSFEVVTRPMGRSEWATFGPELCKALNAAGTYGYNTPNDSTRYGIHVNLHRRHLSALAEARIMMFLCAEQNGEFVRAVAQRASIYHPDMDMGALGHDRQKIERIGGRRDPETYSAKHVRSRFAGKVYGVGKYAPLQLKDSPDVAEFRLFQSTLNAKSFMKNIEFVYALWAWTKPVAGTGSSWDYTEFLTWLNKPQNRKDYPHLVEFLSRKSFRIKGGYSVQNTWLEYMTKPIDEGFVELLAA